MVSRKRLARTPGGSATSPSAPTAQPTDSDGPASSSRTTVGRLAGSAGASMSEPPDRR